MSDFEAELQLRKRGSSPEDPMKMLRDEFALAALTGLCADPELDAPPMIVARTCYGIADAMLAVL